MKMRHITLSLAAASVVLTGCGGDGGDAGAAGAEEASGGEGVIEIEAGDLYFEPESVTATAGETEFLLDNVGAVFHDLVIEEAGDTVIAEAYPGESATGSIELEPGTYTLYCSVPGHRAAMEATLEVS